MIEGALRIGLGKFTTDEEIDQAAEILATAVSQTRKAMCLPV
jgi:cysteine desulfurase